MISGAGLPVAWLGILLLSWLGCGLVVRVAHRVGLVQAPNHRSSHAAPTPHGGGIGIVIGGTVAGGFLGWGSGAAWLGMIVAIAFLVAAVSLWDDIRPLPVRPRLLIHFAACLLAVAILPVGYGSAVVMLVLLAGVWWLNLFNFMDGIDGLAGVQAVFMMGGMAGLALLSSPEVTDSMAWRWLVLSTAAVVGFLAWNWPPARIFMGDVGSIYLGFVLFAGCLASVGEGWSSFPLWLILGAPFIVDATATLLHRAWRGERWLEAHRQHAYQRLARYLNSHRAVTVRVLVFNTICLLPASWLAMQRPDLAWWVVGGVYLLLFLGAAAFRAKGTRGT